MQDKWKVLEVDIFDVVLTEVNANKMTSTQLGQLTANIKKSGLSSVVTCYKRTDGKYVLISGNHRYKAAVKAGYKKIFILYTEEDNLEKDEIIAIQLSHNSLHGSDNKNILSKLFSSISSVEFKEFSYIAAEDVVDIDFSLKSINPIAEYFSVKLMLYSEDVDMMNELMLDVKEDITAYDIVLLSEDTKDRQSEKLLFEILEEIKSKYKIKSSNITFGELLRLAKKGLEAEEKEEEGIE